jgi:hypothetical protein
LILLGNPAVVLSASAESISGDQDICRQITSISGDRTESDV